MKCVSAFLQEMIIDQLQAAGAGPRARVCMRVRFIYRACGCSDGKMSYPTIFTHRL